jgi:serine/threonine protein kinase/Tfp pilus assembly protein PilF
MISRYRILGKVGEGGMGVVYRAEDTRLKRHVALKFLSPHLTRETEARERFMQEAQTASALDHPNICTIHEIDETEDGGVFIAMACYDGETLKAKIDRGPVDEREALEIATRIASGLREAHAGGIVHRDIKPANVMITAKDQVKIMDFGLAKLAGRAGLTLAGTTVGTVAYMSPEQARGEEVDGRSDLWSLGIVLYEMLTARQPFRGEHPQAVIRAILNDEHKPIERALIGSREPITSGESARLLARALAKDRAARYQSAQEMLSDLSKAAAALSRKPGDRPDVPDLPSIAVLPFANLSGDPEQEYFCDGITEELINALSQINGLMVAARTSSFAFKGKLEDIREIGRKLDVDTVVEGSVRKAGDRVRITAQAIGVANGYHLWSERYDRDLSDIFAIQDEISEQVAGKLRGELLEDEKPKAAGRHGDDVEAYSLYLKGRHFWNKRTKEGLHRGIECFKQAIERFPDYALAYSGLAECYLTLIGSGFEAPEQLVPEARAATERALQLDETLAEAHNSLAFIRGFCELNWPAAEAEHKRAIELNPMYATAHHWYALHLSVMGRFDEALAEAELARRIDPLSPMIGTAVGTVLYTARDYDRAIEVLAGVLDIEPGFTPAHEFTAAAHVEKGRYEKARAAIERVSDSLGKPSLITNLATIYARAGERKKAMDLYEELRSLSEKTYVPPYSLAVVCAALGMKDEAFYHLNRAMEDRFGIMILGADPGLDNLRTDPRFDELLRKAGLG